MSRSTATKPKVAPRPPSKPKAGTSEVASAHKRALFVAEYLVNGGNATHAAIAAGYTKRSAAMTGSRLMTRDDVKQAISNAAKKVLHDLEVTNERIIAEYAKAAFLDPRQFYDENGNLIAIHMLPDQIASAVAGMSVESVPGGSTRMTKIKFSDKLKALDSLARINGMFKDTVKVEIVSYAEKLQKARERIKSNR